LGRTISTKEYVKPGPKCLDYQTDKPQFAEPTPGADLSPVRRLLCGGLAGITSVTFTYPLDIVRTRLSIQSAGFAALAKHEGKLPGMWQTMIKMYKTEGGVFGLYRGIVPTIAGVAPYVSVLRSHIEAPLTS
jgi:solute carrier family 25 phosphate transporter 23/24/25/41